MFSPRINYDFRKQNSAIQMTHSFGGKTGEGKDVRNLTSSYASEVYARP